MSDTDLAAWGQLVILLDNLLVRLRDFRRRDDETVRQFRRVWAIENDEIRQPVRARRHVRDISASPDVAGRSLRSQGAGLPT